MLETQMSRHAILQEARFINYLRKHCLSWYLFASDNDILVEFGDIMLVTECSKTAAWASAVYSQSSRDFGLSFSVGGAFLPISHGLGMSAGYERVGSVEHRRSQRRVIASADADVVTKDQTVFIKAYRLGPRSLYQRSLAQKIMTLMNRPSRDRGGQDYFLRPPSREGGSLSQEGPSSVPSSSPNSGCIVDDIDAVTSLSFECPVSIRGLS